MNHVMRVFRQQWFLLSLLAVLLLGFFFPAPFRAPASSASLRNGVVATVLFLMALPLEIGAVRRTFQYPWPALLGSFVNMGCLPLLAAVAARFLMPDFAAGLIVAAAAPCTLASAAVWTRRAGGNDAAAIFVTLLTNATCFLTTPFWLVRLTQTATELEAGPMVLRLALLVVLPMLAAQLVRFMFPQIGAAATRAKVRCGTVAQCGILWMVLTGAVRSGDVLANSQWGETLQLLDFTKMVLATSSVHLLSMYLGYQLARASRMAREDCIAVAIAGSQKTLMVGLHVAITYYSGLAILPMITYHVGQLFLDTLIADRMREGSGEF
ncbi:MAG: bile acid:sodium symporter [Planctomycetales bacterium]|nr:bile acid:sodium symporter [Planctomycetales bacterium]